MTDIFGQMNNGHFGDFFQITVILVSIPTKMTDNLLTRWITVILVWISNNGHFADD